MLRRLPYLGLLLSVAACSSPDDASEPGNEASGCALADSLNWSSTGAIIAPPSDATHDLVAVKDPSIVRFKDRWHVYASTVSTAGAYNMVYASFADFSDVSSATFYHMNQTPGFNTYVAAPQLFYFEPQKKWYLVFQSGPPMYSTNDDPSNPSAWTAPKAFYPSTPATITQNGGGWLDFWIICDAPTCHLFFTDNHGRFYQAKTSMSEFPNGLGQPVVVMQNVNAGRVFEASNVYKLKGTNQFLTIIEAFDQTSGGRRYFRSWLSGSLDGPWMPWQASGSFPFAGARNVTFDGTPWTQDISHGEMVRSGYDQTLTAEACGLRYLYQGADPNADNMGDYNKIPWHLGLLAQTE